MKRNSDLRGYTQNAPNKDFWIIKDNRNGTEGFLHCEIAEFFQYINITICLTTTIISQILI